MEKLDLKEQFKRFHSTRDMTPVLLQIPAANYLMIDGSGDPNTSASFGQAVQALYSVSYTLKFAFKKGASAVDYPVMALEGLWWTKDMETFSVESKDEWLWTLMIMHPEIVTADDVATTVEEVRRKKGLTNLNALRLERFDEGLCAQVVHVGPFSTEPTTIAALHHFIEAQGLVKRGRHHEIYMSDPRKCAPERMKTILRQPVTPPMSKAGSNP